MLYKVTHFSTLVIIAIVAGVMSCSSGINGVKLGQKYFDTGEYELAIQTLQKEIKTDEATTNYLIAESYRLSNRLPQATDYYVRALQAGNKTQDLKLNYAFALKSQGKYAEAQAMLEQYAKPNVVNRTNLEKARREIENLKEVERIVQTKTYFEIKNLENLNTAGAEFSPVMLQDEMLFTTSRKETIYKTNGQGMLALYKTKVNGTEAEKPTLFSGNILKEDVNEGTPAFSKDGKTMIFARGNNGKTKGNTYDVDLYISKMIDGQWTEPAMITAISDSASWEGCPMFSGDGKTLYFCSNRTGGKGGIDIYRVNLDNSGRFGRPVNLGGDINTPGNEMFPYVSADAKLYFASDGHAGLGRLDLFSATRKDGEITVENLGLPFNSTADDFGIVFLDKNKGYFSSNREGGKGDDDIYYFENTAPDKQPEKPVITKTDTPTDPNAPNKTGDTPKKIVKYYLAGAVAQAKILNGEETHIRLENVNIRVIDDAENVIAEAATTKMGTFGSFPVKENRDYTIIAEKEGYYTKRELFSMSGRSIPQSALTKAESDTTFFVTILIDQPSKGQVINNLFTINTIYYDLDKWDIRPDAAVELDKVVLILRDNPQISLELGSHTDSRATDKYNNVLSQRRAESAVSYIVSRGIDASRLKAKGYGESVLINKCKDGVPCTEEEHQANRRTEFKVIGINE
jgi:peptidoglycan-associated lipoprotein